MSSQIWDMIFGSAITANKVLASPNGSAGAATFRSLVAADLPAGTGTVTSVAMTGDGVIFNTTITGSPITTSGTLIPVLLTQTANTVLAGPTSGGVTTPTFRALVTADLPAGTGTVTSFSAGTLSPLFTTSVANSTTTPALSFSLSNAAGGTVFGNNTTSAAAPAYTIAPVLGIPGTSNGTIALASSTASGKFTIATPASAATPTLTLPTTSNVLAGQLAGDNTIFATTLVVASAAGTLTLPTPKNQTANTIFAGPTSGGAAAPTFRTLVNADIPSGTVTLDQVGDPVASKTFTDPATNTLTFTGTAPASVSGAGTAAGTLFTITAPVGGATTGSATTAGTGGDIAFTTGAGGSGAGGTNASGGRGGNLAITLGAGGAKSGTGTAGIAGILSTTGGTVTFTGPGAGNTLTVSQTGGNNSLVILGDNNSTNLVSYRNNSAPTTPVWITYLNGNNLVWFDSSSHNSVIFKSTGASPNGVWIGSLSNFNWTNSNDANGTQDTGLSRISGGTVGIGTGAQGSTAGNLQLAKITSYNAVATVSGGVPAEYATVDLTAQSAAITTTTLYAVPAAGAGMYRVSVYAKITTAASVSSVLGGTNGFQIGFTDSTDSVAQTVGVIDLTNTSLSANSTTTVYIGSAVFMAKESTNITYAFDYTSAGGTAMQYTIHVKLEAM